jgi:hypothetical protein
MDRYGQAEGCNEKQSNSTDNAYHVKKDLKEPPCTGEKDGTWKRRGFEDKGESIDSP